MAGSLVAAILLGGCASDAHATGEHPEVPLVVGVVHGINQGALVFLVGLMGFMALILLPANRSQELRRNAGRCFSRGAWILFGVLLAFGFVEISMFAVRASGESFGPGLLGEALLQTRVGGIWLARIGLSFFAVLLATWAAQEGRTSYWWAATGVGCASLVTLSQLSHAAAEARFLPFVSDWLHVAAASLWMGGLLGFPILLIWPLRTVRGESREKLLGRTVRRFSGTVAFAVAVVVVTGVYAALLHVPSVSALIGTFYGKALIMKLGMVVLMLFIGAINLMDRGRDPFSRMVGAELILAFGVFLATGFLSSLPPAGP